MLNKKKAILVVNFISNSNVFGHLPCRPILWSINSIQGRYSATNLSSNETYKKCADVFWKVIGVIAFIPSAALFLFVGLPAKLAGACWINATDKSSSMPRKLTDSDKLIRPEAILSYLQTEFNIQPEDAYKASSHFNISIGSILISQGVIQDPAGSAIGSGRKPSGGGLSGAIYKQFGNLSPIPQISSGNSILNESNSRILHTHSPFLQNGMDLKTAITQIKDAYLNAITLFVNTKDVHMQNTLNLCAISASIYGGEFAKAGPGGNHIDPSISETALCIALVEYLRENPHTLDDKIINLFYLDNNQALVTKAMEVKEVLSS
ncbi:MAG: hypothetical protein COT84_07510 [Chlamydiae bacterium CG10_big_fil_rev_8_21_14_0_10_35_9]|nr:MAG: hypothetical protein COT84_07510 [Chlamydiae bacterium CG10_big_fil_rev_8_21_14_0_10_35_9]